MTDLPGPSCPVDPGQVLVEIERRLLVVMPAELPVLLTRGANVAVATPHKRGPGA